MNNLTHTCLQSIAFSYKQEYALMDLQTISVSIYAADGILKCVLLEYQKHTKINKNPFSNSLYKYSFVKSKNRHMTADGVVSHQCSSKHTT